MLKVAILGCRGIPAKYGGFETFADGLVKKLSTNFQITVSCEHEPEESRLKEYNGVKLDYFPIKPPENYFLRKIYENISDIYFLLKLSRGYDSIIFLGIEVGMFLFLPKLLNRKIRVMVNIDGVMWKRTKFNFIEKLYLKINHDLAIYFADVVIADSMEMIKYVDEKYHNKTLYLSYGIDCPKIVPWNSETLTKIENFTGTELLAGEYLLVVARLEPENNIHTILKAFTKANISIPLVVLGDFTSQRYRDEIENITEGSANKIFFLGSIFEEDILNMLRQHCKAYIHGHSVGGTNPSLLEAAISKNIILAHNNHFNMEVCKENALYFNNSTDLKLQMEMVDKKHENYQNIKEEVHNRIKTEYSWDKISNGYKNLLISMENSDVQKSSN